MVGGVGGVVVGWIEQKVNSIMTSNPIFEKNYHLISCTENFDFLDLRS